MASNPKAQEAISTARTWYQPKRVPLYIVVGATFAGAASYLWWNSTSPHVEGNRALRKDPLADERGSMAAEGKDWKETGTRKLSRDTGMHRGMESHGILGNETMPRKIGEFLGTSSDQKK
ncbi:hypothetical protein COCOBI_08-5610 [Coccomyxa sp. Obi]|nr:hypothetical protein COCOBI_08-5610 [Coccomyxa sp. Obi]